MEKQCGQKPLSNTELSSFCSQMALILNSGISSMEGISIMLEEASGTQEKEILQTIYDTLMETGNLHSALEASCVFPSYALHMVDIGEQTGRLDEVMDSLSSHYQREENIQKSIRSAVAYPLIMITMMIAVILVLITKVMPIFNQVFAQLGQEMTGFSKGLLGLGTAINRYSIVLIVLLVLIIALFLFFTKTQKGRVAFRRFSYPIPFFRNIYDKTASCRFACVMSLALRSGLNPDYAAELAAGLIDNEAFQKKLEECQKLVSEGTDFSAALTETRIFSGIYGRMTSLAARAGSMDTVMTDIAEKYEDELDSRLSHMLSILEPTLVIILSVIVGIILLSVMLPLMGIMSGL